LKDKNKVFKNVFRLFAYVIRNFELAVKIMIMNIANKWILV